MTMAEFGVYARGVPGAPEDHATIPVWNSKDWRFEDFETSDKIRSLRRTISQGGSVLFKSLVMDHQTFASDKRFEAKGGAFGRRIVAGATVFSYALGLSAKSRFKSRSNGCDRLRFIAPVIFGDTICRFVETVDRGQGP